MHGQVKNGLFLKSIHWSKKSHGTPPTSDFWVVCGNDPRVVLGDARLSLINVPDKSYDVLVLDAFSSDSIPMHLLTREALSLYLRKLAPGGCILFHISSRNLDLSPVIASLAADAGLSGRLLLRGDLPQWRFFPAEVAVGCRSRGGSQSF